MKIQRNSRQRQSILKAVKGRCDHPTADQIYQDVRGTDKNISKGTVYRNLSVLSQNNEITNVRLPEADRYDLRLDRHYHIYCTGCGKVYDAPLSYNAEYDEQIEKETGFRISCHRLVFEGLCNECRSKIENVREE